MKKIQRYEMNHKGLPEPDDNGVWVFRKEHDAIVAELQEQVQKLAAENAALKDAFHPEAVPDDLLDNFGDAVKMDGETFWEGDNCKSFSCVSNAEELIKLSLASMGDIETPATDAVIREIGAKAGKFCDKAPAGYQCTRLVWHDGPCSAVDTNREGQP